VLWDPRAPATKRHLITVLREYEDFYNTPRPHRTLNQAWPWFETISTGTRSSFTRRVQLRCAPAF